MNPLKATIATAAITVCCMGNEVPARADWVTDKRVEAAGFIAGTVCMAWKGTVSPEEGWSLIEANLSPSLIAWTNRAEDHGLTEVVKVIASDLFHHGKNCEPKSVAEFTRRNKNVMRRLSTLSTY